MCRFVLIMASSLLVVKNIYIELEYLRMKNIQLDMGIKLLKGQGLFFITMLFILYSTNAISQTRDLTDHYPYNRFSFELSLGAGFPLENTFLSSNKSDSSFYSISFPSVTAGIRYMITNQFGIKGTYTYHSFKNRPNHFQLKSDHLMGELVYSFSNFFKEGNYSEPRNFNVLAHAGLGYTFGYIKELGTKSTAKTRDMMISGVIGGTIQYRPTNLKNIAFTGDLSGFFNVFQNKNFDGNDVEYGSSEIIDRFLNPKFFFYPSVGVQIFLGRHYQHSDWR
jgi:hypothetical protein